MPKAPKQKQQPLKHIGYQYHNDELHNGQNETDETTDNAIHTRLPFVIWLCGALCVRSITNFFDFWWLLLPLATSFPDHGRGISYNGAAV
jgi:hypothetical protein